jgi:predicted nucleic acid-binding protein
MAGALPLLRTLEGSPDRHVDASVVVRWAVSETGSEQAARLLEDPTAWRAPRLMLTEVASALRRKAVAGALTPTQALNAPDAVLMAIRTGVIALVNDEETASEALRMALDSSHPVPDCIYLAIAEREGAGLTTADTRLATLATRRGVPVDLIPSSN